MKKKHADSKKPFKWKHFSGEIIVWLVRWYCRYALSYNDLKEMAQEQGQVRGMAKGNVIKQKAFIENLFGLAA